MSSELEDLYQQVILEHSKRPRNFGDLAEEGTLTVHGDNPSCGDEIHLHVRFQPDGSVEQVKFTGQGCAISQASASLMTMKIKGRPRAEAEEFMRAFRDLVTDGTENLPKGFGDLQAMGGVRKFPQRVKCAMLAWRAFEQALAERDSGTDNATITTEG